MNDKEQNEMRKLEYELLATEETPSIFGMIDLKYALIGYTACSLFVNTYLSLGDDNMLNYMYLANAIFATIGAIAFISDSLLLMCAYTVYTTCTFIVSSFLSMGAISVIMDPQVCNTMSRLSCLGEQCLRSTNSFRTISIVFVIFQVLLEASIVHCIIVVFNHHYHKRSGILFEPRYGSITISE